MYLLMLVVASHATADRIEMTNGRIVEGIVVYKGETKVTIKVGNAESQIPADKIRRIIPGSEADNKVIAARGMLADRTEQGIVVLGEAAREGGSPETVANLLFLYQEEITRTIPKLGTETRDALREALKAAGGVRLLRRGDYLVVQLHWRILMDDQEEERRLLSELQQSEPRAFEQSRDLIVQWMTERIDRALDAGQISQALDLLIDLRQISQDQAGLKRTEMTLLWGRREREKGNYEKALQVYVDQLMDVSPAIARERIAATLEEAERAFRSQGQPGRAAELYERFGLPHASPLARERLTGLWRDIGMGLLKTGNTQEARAVFRRLESIKKGGAERELRLCDYGDARSKLAPEDAVGFYKLGEWCLEGSLTEEARACFAKASAEPELQETISAQIQRVNNIEADRELSRLMDLYEKGQYLDVMHGLSDLKARPFGEGFHKQADDLEKLTKDAIQIAAAERPQQGEVLWQQAERAYFIGQLQKSYDLLKDVMQRYGDTPAGGRALAFYRRIRPRLDIDAMEKGRHRRDLYPEIDPAGAGASGVEPSAAAPTPKGEARPAGAAAEEAKAAESGARTLPTDSAEDSAAIQEEIRRLRQTLKTPHKETP